MKCYPFHGFSPDLMTRQNTMMERDHTFHLTTEDTMYQRSQQPHLPPLPQHQHEQPNQPQEQLHQDELTTPRTQGRRGSLMFEENPRELEPFVDPRLKSRQGAATASQHHLSPSPHKRHGLLDHMEKHGEGAEIDISRDKLVSQGKLTPRTPRGPSKVDSPAVMRDGEKSRSSVEHPVNRGDSRSRTRLDLKVNLASPHGDKEQAESDPKADKRDSPSRVTRREGPGSRGLSPQKQNLQRLSPNPKHDVSAGALSELSDTPRDGNGNVLEREYVLMTDRTGVTSQSDLDLEGLDTFRGAEALANRHRDMPQYQVQERRLSRRSADLRDASMDDQDTTLDMTIDITSGGPGHNRSGLTSGQYADLSCTAESVDLPGTFGVSHGGQDLTPNAEEVQPNPAVDRAVKESQDLTPRRRRTHRAPRGISDQGEKTPGRFTRESFFEEEEYEQEVGESTTIQNPDDTFDFVSVSRQHLVHPRDTANKTEKEGSGDIENPVQRSSHTQGLHNEAENVRVSGLDQLENTNTGPPVPFERQSSKVSLKGRSHEAGEVTLETTRPYRVSSAKANRSRNEDWGEAQVDKPEAEARSQNACEEKRPLRSRPEEAFSPVKTPKSHVTTGSGWDGDVSMESAVEVPEMKLSSSFQPKGDNPSLQQPTISRQKTKIKHKKKPDANTGDDDDEKLSLAPKPSPRKKQPRRSPPGISQGGASAADDEDDDIYHDHKSRGDNRSLNSNKLLSRENNDLGDNKSKGDNTSLKSNKMASPINARETSEVSGNKMAIDTAGEIGQASEVVKDEVLQGSTEDSEAERLRQHQETVRMVKTRREEKALSDINSVPVSGVNSEGNTGTYPGEEAGPIGSQVSQPDT